MALKHLFVAAPAVFLILGGGAANAGQTINEEGPTVCATDKWNELSLRRDTSWSTSLDDGVCVSNDPALPSHPHDCVGKYEYMPDGSWKGSGTCTAPTKMETS